MAGTWSEDGQPVALLPHHVRFLYDCDDGTLARGRLPDPRIPAQAQTMAERALALIRHPVNDFFVAGFAADVQGASVADWVAYRRRLVALCAYLLGLADERRVRLAAIPDVFCAACVVGAHCRRLQPEGEEYFLRTFVDMVRALKADAGGKAGGRGVAVALRDGQHGAVVDTTFGTVRAVLRHLPCAELRGWEGLARFAS
jgi:hypothetical protein